MASVITVGRHTTRDGRKAYVHFILQEPNDCMYTLIGEVQGVDGKWCRQTWTPEGFSFAGVTSATDILDPPTFGYFILGVTGVSKMLTSIPPLTNCIRVELNKDGHCDWKTLEKLDPNDA